MGRWRLADYVVVGIVMAIGVCVFVCVCVFDMHFRFEQAARSNFSPLPTPPFPLAREPSQVLGGGVRLRRRKRRRRRKGLFNADARRRRRRRRRRIFY